MDVNELVIDDRQKYDPSRNKKQYEFITAPETYKLFGGAMGGGKTAALINEGIDLNLDYPGNYGLLMRKTWPSFRDTVLPQLEKFLSPDLVVNWNHSQNLVTMINGSRIRYGGIGDRPDDWEKFMSGEYGWIALDQAEQFTEKEFMMLATRLRLNLPDIQYYFLLSCNPNIGWIKERFIERNPKDHIFIPSLPTDNRANLPSDYVAKMKEILTPVYIKALLEGDWEAVGEPDNVYNYLQLQAAKKRRLTPGLPIEIGGDIARGGDDETIIMLREGLKISLWNKAQGHDTMRTTGEIWRCCSDRIIPRWKNGTDRITIKIDADGVGGGVVDRLKEQKAEKQELYTKMILDMLDRQEREKYVKAGYKLKIKIVEIHGAAKARDPVHFRNQRAEIHWGLRELLDDIDLPDDRELTTQLMAIKYKQNSAGQIEIIPKDKIKETLGRSPDYAEAVIYSLAEIRQKEYRIWRA